MAKDEPQLCPECPLIALMSLIKRPSWTLQPEKPSSVQLCRRLRAEAVNHPSLSCPYYKHESLLFFMPCKAKSFWVHRAKVQGLNRFFSPEL